MQKPFQFLINSFTLSLVISRLSPLYGRTKDALNIQTEIKLDFIYFSSHFYSIFLPRNSIHNGDNILNQWKIVEEYH